jgi:hypothetical protein
LENTSWQMPVLLLAPFPTLAQDRN